MHEREQVPNRFMVDRHGEDIRLRVNPTRAPLNREEALNLAAWLCVVASIGSVELYDLVGKIEMG